MGILNRQILKEWKFLLLILAELILLGWGALRCFDTERYRAEFGDDAIPVEDDWISLESGYYEMDIYYFYIRDDLGDYSCHVGAELSYGDIFVETVLLPCNRNHVEAEFELREATEKFYLYVEDWDAMPFQIERIEIREMRRGDLKNVFLMACLFLLIDIFAVFWKRGFFQHIDIDQRRVLFGMCGICLVASLPVFVNYVIYMQDISVHLMRIEGLAEELKNGIFPVRMQTTWLNGYGYPISIMYGDILLYIPAVLRLVGFSLQDAYHIYMILINIVTTCTSYYCVKKMTGSSRIGLMGCLLYTWAEYRLFNMYYRNAVGEFTAMAFLPLVFVGLYLLLETEEKKKGCICMALGYTMILQSHILSFEMVILFSVFYCLANIKKLLKNIGRLFSTACITILLNLGFLVPFFDYMGSQDMAIYHEMGTGSGMQREGLFIPQLFASFWIGGEEWSAPTVGGINSDMLLTMGLSFLAVLALWLWGVVIHGKSIRESVGKDNWLEQKRVFVLIMIALWMCCYFFPWTAIGEIPVIGGYLTVYQFPWRFLAMGTVMGTILAGYALRNLNQIMGKQICTAVAVVIGAIALLGAAHLTDYIMQNVQQEVIASDAGIADAHALNGAEYLPSATDWKRFTIQVATGGLVRVDSLDKEKSDYIVTCANMLKETSWVEVPRLMYKGYIAEDTQTGERFEITAGDNNKIRITLPARYEGSIRVTFRQPVFWIVAEVVAAITGVVVIIWLFLTRKKEIYHHE